MRGLDIGWAGLAISMVALAGLLGNPVGGYLADRIGARNALVCGLAVAAAGSAALAAVQSVGGAFTACAFLGLGAAVIWPSQDALLAELVEPSQRSNVFAVRHATMNFGLAAGAATAGLLANLSSPASFERLYLMDGLTFLAVIPVLMLRRDLDRSSPVHGGQIKDGSFTKAPGFRQVVADRMFRWVFGWTFLLVVVGAAQFHAAFPAYATREGGVTAGGLGTVYAANAVAVLIVQLPVLKFMTGRRRTRGMALVCLCWAAAWALTLLAAAGRHADSRLWVFVLAMVVFAVGEAFLSSTVVPLVNDLAPANLRGRYNGLYALAWTAGYIVGPASCGLAFTVGKGAAFFTGCIALLGVAAMVARYLEWLLAAGLNTGERDAAPEQIQQDQ